MHSLISAYSMWDMIVNIRYCPPDFGFYGSRHACSMSSTAMFPVGTLMGEVVGWAEQAPKAWCDIMWVCGRNYF